MSRFKEVPDDLGPFEPREIIEYYIRQANMPLFTVFTDAAIKNGDFERKIHSSLLDVELNAIRNYLKKCNFSLKLAGYENDPRFTNSFKFIRLCSETGSMKRGMLIEAVLMMERLNFCVQELLDDRNSKIRDPFLSFKCDE